MDRLVNVPRRDAVNIAVQPVVEGETIYIVAGEKNAQPFWRNGRSVSVTEVYIPDHMLSKPQELREYIGRTIAGVIIRARDIGHEQAKAELREWIGQ